MTIKKMSFELDLDGVEHLATFDGSDLTVRGLTLTEAYKLVEGCKRQHVTVTRTQRPELHLDGDLPAPGHTDLTVPPESIGDLPDTTTLAQRTREHQQRSSEERIANARKMGDLVAAVIDQGYVNTDDIVQICTKLRDGGNTLLRTCGPGMEQRVRDTAAHLLKIEG